MESEDDSTVEDAVEVVYSGKAREMQEAVVASHQRVAEIENEIKAAEDRAAEATLNHQKNTEDASAKLKHEKEAWEAEKQALNKRTAEVEAGRDKATEDAQRTERRIKAMEEQLESEAKVRKRNRRFGLGGGLVAFGVVVAVIGALVVFDSGLGIGGVVLAGIALVLAGARVILGKQRGNEFVAWAGLFSAVAAVVLAIALR